MKIVILDGYTENPGDLSWAPLETLGDVTIYDRVALDDEDVRLKHRSDGCGTASALPKCSIRHPVLSALLA